MTIPAGIEIFQPPKTDILGSGVGPCIPTVSAVPFVCICSVLLGTGVEKSCLLLVEAGEGIKQE